MSSIMDMLQGAPQGAPDQGPPQGAPQDGPISMYTQAAIQALHDAIAHEPDPADKAILAQCLQQILKVQAKNAAQQGAQGPSGALQGQLTGQ